MESNWKPGIKFGCKLFLRYSIVNRQLALHILFFIYIFIYTVYADVLDDFVYKTTCLYDYICIMGDTIALQLVYLDALLSICCV